MNEGNSFIGSDSDKLLATTIFLLKRTALPQTVTVSVDFSPYSSTLTELPNPHPELLKATPLYNQDGHFFTPAFILEVDKPKYFQNAPIYHEMFLKKAAQADEEITDMYLPKPSKNNSFCCVCKSFFEDYLTHVNLPLHQTFMEKSEFNSEIHHLCAKFNPSVKESRQKQPKTKTLKTKTVKKVPKTKKTTKAQLDSFSTRTHESSLVCPEVN